MSGRGSAPGAARPGGWSAEGDRSRERFLGRVGRVLGHSRSAREAPRVAGDLVRLAGAGDDLISLFARRASECGAVVRTIAPSGLAAGIADLLAETGTSTAIAALERIPHAAGLVEEAARRTIRVVDSASAPLRAGAGGPGTISVETAGAGVTGVEAAIAESGTLVCVSRPGEARSLSLLPPVHVAVVRSSDIVPDLLDALRLLGDRPELPAAVTLITGPSKTADIEGALVTGVHGPGKLHIILVPGI